MFNQRDATGYHSLILRVSRISQSNLGVQKAITAKVERDSNISLPNPEGSRISQPNPEGSRISEPNPRGHHDNKVKYRGGGSRISKPNAGGQPDMWHNLGGSRILKPHLEWQPDNLAQY